MHACKKYTTREQYMKALSSNIPNTEMRPKPKINMRLNGMMHSKNLHQLTAHYRQPPIHFS